MHSDIVSDGKGFAVLVDGEKVGKASTIEEAQALRAAEHAKRRGQPPEAESEPAPDPEPAPEPVETPEEEQT